MSLPSLLPTFLSIFTEQNDEMIFFKDLFLAFFAFIDGDREGERHAVKVVMNGIRTRDTLSG